MKRILFALFISIISFVNISCKAQDNIGWVQSELVYENINYGLLYNWYAVADSRNITASGWKIPASSDFETLMLYLDSSGTPSSNISGGKMKETGTVYWNSPNTGASNSSAFNCRGGGYRSELGVFSNILNVGRFWNSTEQYSTTAFYSYCSYNNQTFNTSNYSIGYTTYKKVGNYLRPVKISTSLTNGQTGTYVGNDGKVYHTICIGTQEWLSENLAETKYRNGDAIPEVTDNTTWSGLTTGAWCYYNNDPTKK